MAEHVQHMLEANNKTKNLEQVNQNLIEEKQSLIDEKNAVEASDKLHLEQINDYKVMLTDSEAKYSKLESDFNTLNSEKVLIS